MKRASSTMTLELEQMTVFFGTVLIFTLCALALGLGILSGREPPKGTCNGAGSSWLKCLACPVRRHAGSCRRASNKESPQ